MKKCPTEKSNISFKGATARDKPSEEMRESDIFNLKIIDRVAERGEKIGDSIRLAAEGGMGMS